MLVVLHFCTSSVLKNLTFLPSMCLIYNLRDSAHFQYFSFFPGNGKNNPSFVAEFDNIDPA